jgi:hypothetical protein
MNTPRTSTTTLIAALRALARSIESQDGVANAAILEAAERMEEMLDALVAADKYLEHRRFIGGLRDKVKEAIK